ncbi:MAG: hypothetical protein U9N30_04610 [Campylobacterota bacterium]|nr:hypothetical protein [Campylobacterota bacterium]
MIVIVKKPLHQKMIAKVLSMVALVAMFTVYYFYMGDKFAKEGETSSLEQVVDNQTVAKVKLAKKLEKIIFKESETVVDLVGQKNIQKIKVVGKTLFIVCDSSTDIEPLMVRYGVLALVKNTNKDIKIAIDLKHIIGDINETS